MKLMDQKSEARLIKASEDVIENVNRGTSPTEALIKVAQSFGFGPEEIRRVGEVYNTSRTMQHLKTAQGDDRHSTVPLIAVDDAVDRVFKPENESIKAASAGAESVSGVNYFDQEKKAHNLQSLRAELGQEKQASQHQESPMVKKARLSISRRKVEQYRELAKRAAADFEKEVMGAREQLRSSGTPFHELEIGVRARHEKVGKELSEMLWTLCKSARLGHRRATPSEIDASRYTMMDLNTGGHATIERLVKKSLEFQGRAKQYAQAMVDHQQLDPEEEGQRKEAAAKPTPFGSTETESLANKYFTKKAIGESVGKIYNSVKKHLGTDVSEEYERALLEASNKFQDPDFRQSMKQINVQTMLNDFLSNDPVISEYEPEEVTDYFNQLAQVAPDVADKPAVMRGLLRRSLQQGSIDVFEAGQVASISGDIARNENDQAGELTSKLIEEKAQTEGMSQNREKMRMEDRKQNQAESDAAIRNSLSAAQLAHTKQRDASMADYTKEQDKRRLNREIEKQDLDERKFKDQQIKTLVGLDPKDADSMLGSKLTDYNEISNALNKKP